MDAAVAATLLKDLPTIADPITSAGWRAHLKRINLFFHIKGVQDVAANNALKRTLLYYSLGNAGGQKAYHLSPDQRPAEETYVNYLAELGKVFVPPQESDMARSDYRKCKQAKNEPLQTFHNKKTRLWYDAYQITPQNIASHMDNFLEEYLASIVRREVKLDLIEHKPYARPEDVLSRALSSAAKHRMLITETAPASAYDGLHSTNQAVASPPAAAGAGARAAVAAGAEPMEIGMINHEDEGYDEQALYALTGEESIMETNMWEDPDCQMFNALDQSGKQTSLCWQCHKPGHQKRDCWSRPRNQMIMGNRGGSSTSYRANPSRGRGRARGGNPSAAYRRTVDIAQQAGRGGPRAFMGQQRRNGGASNYANALYNIHEQEQGLYMLSLNEVTSTDGEFQTPAAAAQPDSNEASTSSIRPDQSFVANF